jgi:hypothetical protein
MLLGAEEACGHPWIGVVMSCAKPTALFRAATIGLGRPRHKQSTGSDAAPWSVCRLKSTRANNNMGG